MLLLLLEVTAATLRNLLAERVDNVVSDHLNRALDYGDDGHYYWDCLLLSLLLSLSTSLL